MNANIRSFVENNRQTGSTTSLAKLAADHGGFLIVHNARMRDHVLKMEPRLWPTQVLTLPELMLGKLPLTGERQVFLDVACLCAVENDNGT